VSIANARVRSFDSKNSASILLKSCVYRPGCSSLQILTGQRSPMFSFFTPSITVPLVLLIIKRDLRSDAWIFHSEKGRIPTFD
jgi:hypothetical protein